MGGAFGHDGDSDREAALLDVLEQMPVVAVAVFVIFYCAAAALYPGGSRAHPDRVGFSFVENFWCDLLEATTYDGRVNGGRAFALAGTVVLSAGLAALWWSTPALFPRERARGIVIRATGIVSAAITPFIATSIHDLAIRSAGLFGVVGFVATVTGRPRAVGVAFRVSSWGTLALAVFNYGMWETGVGHAALALVQKMSFAAFLAWVVMTARSVAGLRRRDRASGSEL